MSQLKITHYNIFALEHCLLFWASTLPYNKKMLSEKIYSEIEENN